MVFRSLGIKLFISYLVIIFAGGIVLATSAGFILPTAFDHHMANMMGGSMMGPGMMPMDMTSDLYTGFRSAVNEALLKAGAANETAESIRAFAVSASYLRARDGGVPAKAQTPVVYTQRWAYVPVGPGGGRELYDIAEDPLAARDVAEANASVCDELHAKLLKWLEDVDAPEEAAAPFRAE